MLLDGDEVCQAFKPEEVELIPECDESQNLDVGSQESGVSDQEAFNAGSDPKNSVTLSLEVLREILDAADEETLTLHQLRTHRKALHSKLESASELVIFDHTPSLEPSYTWLELLHIFLVGIESDGIRFPKVLKQVKQALRAENSELSEFTTPELQVDLTPQTGAVKHRNLLIIGCAQSKDDTEGLVHAISRYTGPMYKMLGKLFDRDVVQAASVDIWILSAEFGLIPAGEKIPHYDRRMTRDRAKELQPQVSAKLKEIATAQIYHEVYIDLGKDYMLALNLKDGGLREYFSHTHPDGVGYLTELKLGDGGIGERVSKVKLWLESLAQGFAAKRIRHLANNSKERLCGADAGLYYLLSATPDTRLSHLPNLCPDCLQSHLPQTPEAPIEQPVEASTDLPSAPLTLNDRLLQALNSGGDWQDLRNSGCTDAVLKQRIGETFIRSPNQAAVGDDSGWSAEGGEAPKFWDKFYVSLDDSPSLQGGELVRRSRRVLQIPYPPKIQPIESTPPVDRDYKFEPTKANRKGSSEVLQGSLF